MLSNISKKKQGFTLIEVIISTAIFSILAIGITAMLVPTMNVYRESNDQAEQMMVLDYFQDELTSVLTSASTVKVYDGTGLIVVDGNEYTCTDGYYTINGQEPMGKDFYHGNFVSFEFYKLEMVPTGDQVVQVTINLFEDSNQDNEYDESGTSNPDKQVNERTFYVNMPLV